MTRPCENGWWRGVERHGCLRLRLQESGVFQPAVAARRLACARWPHFERWNRVREATFSQPGLRLYRCDQWSGPHDVDDAGKIVGEHVQRLFGGDGAAAAEAVGAVSQPFSRSVNRHRHRTGTLHDFSLSV
jgi:hypothetical protein